MRKFLEFLSPFYRYPKYLLEFLLVANVLVISNLMPFRISSFMFGKICGFIGPIIPPSSRITNNLRFIYPLMEEKFVSSLTKAIWVNTGRFIGEMPHFMLSSWRSLKKYVTVKNEQTILQYVKNGKSVILVSAHIGNWWFAGKFFDSHKIPMSPIYRKPNNPMINFMWRVNSGKKISKGTGNLKMAIELLRSNGKILSILQDHRDRNGISSKLLGQSAMTSTAFAKLAIKYKVPVIYAICIRNKLRPTDFTLSFEEVYNPESTNLGEVELTNLVNDKLSKDIHENREQWFWLHKRWKR